MSHNHYDIVVLGGGIVGLTTALALQKKYPKHSLAVIEQETSLALHQTGRNSGVIHAGVYYKPGSLKAKFCVEGSQAMMQFCKAHQIPYRQCGKLIVATHHDELPRLESLLKRGRENGLKLEQWSRSQVQAAEPNIESLAAIYSPQSAIVDYRTVCDVLAKKIRLNGAHVYLNTRINQITPEAEQTRMVGRDTSFTATTLIACPGIEADRIVEQLGIEANFRMMPFRGEYFSITPEKQAWVSRLIYPVPDPELPFLGVHITPMIDDSITVGPNAMLAMARYGYHKNQFKIEDMVNMLSYPGAWRLIWKHRKSSIEELLASLIKRRYVSRVNRLSPGLVRDDLGPYPSGIRAQAVLNDGSMVDDFLFKKTKRALVVCNAPSPAATSSFPIADYIVQQASEIIGS